MITLKDHKTLGFALITLLMAAPVALAYGQYLYLITNDCATPAWVQSSSAVVHNSTLEAWGLEALEGAAPIYEDFTHTDWVEAYGAGLLSQTAARSIWTTYDRSDEIAFGRLNHPDATEGEFQGSMFHTLNITYVENTGGGTALISPLVWSNWIYPDYVHIDAGNYEAYGYRVLSELSQISTFYLQLWELQNGDNFYSITLTGLEIGTAYYMNFTKAGTAVTLEVYTDSGFTSLYGELSLTLHADHANLDALTMPLGHDANGNRDSSGYVEDLTFGAPGGGYAAEGFLYTEELLVNTTMGPAYMFSTRQTVPEGSGLTVAFSEDNLTWVRSTTLETVAGDLHSCVYLGDLNYTALYARFNFTSDGSATPSLFSLDLAYEIEDPGEGGNGWIYALCASPVMIALGLILKLPGVTR